MNVPGKETRRWGQLLVLTILLVCVALACTKIYQKRYRLKDETLPEISFGGYRIELELQSRPSGYEENRNMFHLAFVYGALKTPFGDEASQPNGILDFDSVQINMFMTDSVAFPRKGAELTVMDDYYSHKGPRYRVQYSPVPVEIGNQFVKVSYIVKLLDSESGEELNSRKFVHELRRFNYRSY